MRVQSAPSLPALATGTDAAGTGSSEGLEIFVSTRKYEKRRKKEREFFLERPSEDAFPPSSLDGREKTLTPSLSCRLPSPPSRCAADAEAAAAAEAPQQGPPHPLRLRYLRPQPPHLRREPARLLAGPRRGLGGQPLSLGGPRGVGPQRGGALLERGGGGLTRREPRAEALVLLLQGGLAQGEGAGGEPEGEL